MNQLNINDLKWQTCDCDPEKEHMFEQRLLFKHLSALIAPDGNEQLIPIDVIVCSSCHKVPSFFWQKLPVEIPKQYKAKHNSIMTLM